MSEDFPIEREDAPGHGRYVIHLPDGLEAEMTFRKLGEGKIAIDHTYTPPEHRGQNIAEDVTFSGTIAGAMQGMQLGIP